MADSYNGVPVPRDGERITYKDGRIQVPSKPIIPFIEGDGTGRDIWKASVRVFDAAVQRAYAGKLIEFLNKEMLKGGKKQVRTDSGVGIKPISIFATKRLVRMAIQHALENGRKTVTLVHKGNIQKFTEGAFRKWGYELATEEFRD